MKNAIIFSFKTDLKNNFLRNQKQKQKKKKTIFYNYSFKRIKRIAFYWQQVGDNFINSVLI